MEISDVVVRAFISDRPSSDRVSIRNRGLNGENRVTRRGRDGVSATRNGGVVNPCCCTEAPT